MSRREDSVSLRQMLDHDILWHIVTVDFPSLALKLRALLKAE